MSSEVLKYAFYGLDESLTLNMIERETVEAKVFQKSKCMMELFHLYRTDPEPTE